MPRPVALASSSSIASTAWALPAILLDAHDTLSDCGVAIRSATERFDTSSPIGSFLFQLLASLAELEKSTISERTSRGRDRVTAHGKWTCGPIPFGYDLDDKGYLVASERIVETRRVTEAELVADMFVRVARRRDDDQRRVPAAQRARGPPRDALRRRESPDSR